jgi:gluconolactonase
VTRVLATEVGITEGPVWHDGTLWWTRLDDGGGEGAVLRLDGAEVVEAVATGGGANGLVVAADGTFYVANDGGRDHRGTSGIQRVTAGGGGDGGHGDVTYVATTTPDGRPFRHCNDLCFGPDGWIWFTDSGARYGTSAELFDRGAPPEDPGLVCRLDPATGEVQVVDASLYMPNGLAFSPGDEVLYVSDTVAHRLTVFPYRDGALGPAERTIAIDGNPDGMCLDRDGRLYVATATGGEVHVLTPDGTVEQRLRWADGAIPLNCCFGGTAGTTLYVTDAGGMPNVARDPAADHARERIVAVELDVAGLPLHR